MDLASTFSTLPNVTSLGDLADAWHWGMAPGFDFAAALSNDGKNVFQCYALDSYDEQLVRAILAFAREHSAELVAPQERSLVALGGFAYPDRKFDLLVAISPTVHKYHAKDNPELHQLTRAVFPAYRCEFAGDETEDDTRYRYARAAGVPATKLAREPYPYLKLRYRADTGRVIPERGFAQPRTLVHELRTLEDRPDRFVEFENYRHEVLRAEWNGTWALGGESAPTRELGIDELIDSVEDTLYGPNRDAGTGQMR